MLLTSASSSNWPQVANDKKPAILILNLGKLNSLTLEQAQEARPAGVTTIGVFDEEDMDKTLQIHELALDDFLFRPLHQKEFICRIQVLLHRYDRTHTRTTLEKRRRLRRRSDRWQSSNNSRHQPHPRVYIDDHRKVVKIEGKEVELTPKEYKLFHMFASEIGRVFSCSEIIDSLWKDSNRAAVADVQQYVHLLRRKIEKDPAKPKWISTVKGFGYKLEFPGHERNP
ncbi:MAG: response regulator transcription factor [Gammaproteobacteria bacterium]|nr:response regulator transcription factor [Gammaproteobacteria bacterium]